MIEKQISKDAWEILRQYTDARIALGRTGSSLSTQNILSLNEAHAQARDSIYKHFDKNSIEQSLLQLHHEVFLLNSKVRDKKEFLLRPDLGRRLCDDSITVIQKANIKKAFDVCISVSDGLSATAVNSHAIPFIGHLLKKLIDANLSIAPICLIENGRVAISDEIGSLLKAKVSIILIGERPGLSSSDSMGVYLTYHPKVGNTDEQRNCVSNIRLGGMPFEEAAREIFILTAASIRLNMSGTLLKNSLSITDNQ